MSDKDCFSWNIEGKLFDKIISAKNGEIFRSESFKIHNLEWRIDLIPNGYKPSHIGSFQIFVKLLKLPKEYKNIAVLQSYQCAQTQYNVTKLTTYSKSRQSRGWGSNTLRLKEITDLKLLPKKLTITIRNIVLQVISKKNDKPLYHSKLTNDNYKQSLLNWELDQKQLRFVEKVYNGKCITSDSTHKFNKYSAKQVGTANKYFAKYEWSSKEPLQTNEYNCDAYKVLSVSQVTNKPCGTIIDWNVATNIISVALGDKLELHSPARNQSFEFIPNTNNPSIFGIRKPDYSNASNPMITALSSSPNGQFVAVGTGGGSLTVWDFEKNKCVKAINNHKQGNIDLLEWSRHWSDSCITYGSKDTNCITIVDFRAQKPTKTITTPTYNSNLKWSLDGKHLALGSHCISVLDYRVLDHRLLKLKAGLFCGRSVTWSPHNNNKLISAGKTVYGDRLFVFDLSAEHRPDFYDANCAMVSETISIRTLSQTRNIIWSPLKSNEVLSTNQYWSTDMDIYDISKQRSVHNMRGHTKHVLSVALSPSQNSVVTLSGDETLRIWNVFSDNYIPAQPSESIEVFSEKSCICENNPSIAMAPLLSMQYSHSTDSHSTQCSVIAEDEEWE